MSFSLPDLPYSHDALAPYMSRETLEYHHDKHHQAYVTNGNNAMKGTEFEGKSLDAVFAENSGIPRRCQPCERIACEAVENLFGLREGPQT